MWQLKTKTDKGLQYVNTNTGEQVNCGRIYTHPELGNFYAFDNIMQMPYQRKYIFDLAQTMEKIGMDKDELKDKVENIMNLCKEKKQGWELDVYATAQHIDATLKNAWDYQKTAMLICAMVVIQEGENIGMFDQGEAEAKIKSWSKDKSMLGFFLSIVNQRCSILTGFLDRSTPMFSQAGNL
jgi:hypothetical protein